MNVLSQLTLRNLRLNRKRTIVTIIGIILAGAMICGVATLVASFQDVMIRSTAQTDGSHHVTFKQVRYENSKYITEHANTETSMLTRQVGFAPLEGLRNADKPYLVIHAYDGPAFAHLPLTLISGRYPQEAGEMIIAEDVFLNGGVEIQIGDTLTLDIGQRTDNGAVLVDEPLSETETFTSEYTRTYTVTGIFERPWYLSYAIPGYMAIAYLDETELTPDTLVDVSITAKKPRRIYDTAPELATTTQAAEISYNSELLRWMGITNSPELADIFETIGLIVILLVVIGSVSVIYNAFAISVSERKKQFGMLSSVGATGRQIRLMVFYEAFVLGLVGIPIGILSGIGGIWVTLQVINRLMPGSFMNAGTELELVVLPSSIIVSVCFIALTIFLSAFIPARRAARISPIDAIRLTTEIQIKGKQLRTSRLTRRLFGIEGELALKNLKRQRKRYRATVFSLFISIVLYVSFSSFMTYGFAGSNLYYTDRGFDIAVQKYDESTYEVKLELYEKISDMDVVEQYAIVRYQDLITTEIDESMFSDYVREEFIHSSNDTLRSLYMRADSMGGSPWLQVFLVSIGRDAFTAYASELQLDAAEYLDADHPRGILINRNRLQTPFILTEYEPMNIQPGDRLSLQDYDFDDGITPYRFELEIGAVTDVFPYGVTPGGPHVQVIVSEEVYESIIPRLHPESQTNNAMLYMEVEESADHQAIMNQIEDINARLHPGGLYIHNSKLNQETIQNTKTVISIFLYGFVSLIALIGVTNIFNTISTNVALRRREFAMLKSVGMTPAGFSRMLNYECIFYGLKSLMYGLPVSILISYWLYNSMTGLFGFGFTLPWREIAICVASVFLIVFITMLQSSSKMKKENIIDALKAENV